YRGHQRVGTPEYLSMMRLRKIWAEGSFSALKREHCISKIRKRGILAAMALNLKRMANAIFFISIFTILPIPLRVSAEFLPLSTGPTLDGTTRQNNRCPSAGLFLRIFYIFGPNIHQFLL
ncbi:MAG: hypothetical protein SPG83_10550, partial [Intestinimonas sp.]|uniref:hypothetical protein n=1 Tax=Intestinimonas sp. TaxID=1965293 RepID=UPI002A91D98D